MVIDFDALEDAISSAEQVDEAEENRRGLMKMIQKAKGKNLRCSTVAEVFNSQGLTTATGKKWSATTVQKFWQNNKELLDEN